VRRVKSERGDGKERMTDEGDFLSVLSK
jgi:hypothetical protein